MATNKGVKTAVKKAASTVGRQDKLTAAMIKAGTKIGSYKNVMDMDPNEVSKLKTSELRSVVAKLNKIESKRLANLEKYGFRDQYRTQAVRAIDEAGGKTVAARDMSRNELLHEFKRAKAFLTSSTSSVQGAKTFYKGVQEMVGANRYLTNEEIEELYEILDRYAESRPFQTYLKGDKGSSGYTESVNLQRDIWKSMQEGKTKDQILVELGVMKDIEYEAQQNISDDFTIFTGATPFD